jgi:hypothetical protein
MDSLYDPLELYPAHIILQSGMPDFDVNETNSFIKIRMNESLREPYYDPETDSEEERIIPILRAEFYDPTTHSSDKEKVELPYRHFTLVGDFETITDILVSVDIESDSVYCSREIVNQILDLYIDNHMSYGVDETFLVDDYADKFHRVFLNGRKEDYEHENIDFLYESLNGSRFLMERDLRIFQRGLHTDRTIKHYNKLKQISDDILWYLAQTQRSDTGILSRPEICFNLL